ncbi:hypothetical protein JTE90_014733 [Oedothorax gibbosus]|uniref:Uncharacterized protein n=1 Tax=Oedothorax gibbosus TaxID=931172 RepID=A0AAV6UQT1_9ARAC|nr:hypothetical protein JTE90_014733 [Oedothorax gibbosus]
MLMKRQSFQIQDEMSSRDRYCTTSDLTNQEIIQIDQHLKKKTHFEKKDDKLFSLLSKKSKRIKYIKELKGTIAKYQKELEIKDNTVMKMKKHVKRNWILLFNFKRKLERSEALTCDEESEFSQRYQEFLKLGFSEIKGISKDLSTIADDLCETSTGCSDYNTNNLNSEVKRVTSAAKDSASSSSILPRKQYPTAQANASYSLEIEDNSSQNAYQTVKFNSTSINDIELGRKCIVQIKRMTPSELNNISSSQLYSFNKRKILHSTPLLPIEKPDHVNCYSEKSSDNSDPEQREICKTTNFSNRFQQLSNSKTNVICNSQTTTAHSLNKDISQGTKKTKKTNFEIGDKSLRNYFQLLKYASVTSENLKDHALGLLTIACNPDCHIDVNLLLFHVLNFVHQSKAHPLLEFSSTKDPADLLPISENCIVTAILLMEHKKKPHLQGLLRNALSTTHDLILSKKLLPLSGLAALCRFFAELCKRQGITANPVILCAEILKMKHKFAFYLIASVAGVWPELFQNSKNLEAEEVLLHSSISYGASKDVSTSSECRWIGIKHILSKYFIAPPISDARSAICNMRKLIELRCRSRSWNGKMLTSALVILAAFEEWSWNEEHLLKIFIIPNLNKFGREDLDEHAFDLFCNLYVDIILLNQENPCDTVLLDFFNNSTPIDGNNFVRDCAALSLIKLIFKKNRLLPPYLYEWCEGNLQNPKVQQIKPIMRKRAMSDNLKEIQFEDILQSQLQ